MTSALNVSKKDLHFEILEWKSELQYIEGEIKFIKQLLHAAVFESATSNLFERLQEFNQGVSEIETALQSLKESLGKHENELGGILECEEVSCDTIFFQRHAIAAQKFNDFYKDFQSFKAKVFGYTGGILKKE